jgi:dihydrofolate reductase
MRDLVYYVATTLDGFIARPDGSFGEFPWDDTFGAHLMEHFPETFPAPYRPPGVANQRFDAVLMGRATYEVGQREGLASPYPTLDQYLFSRTLEESPDEAVTLVTSDAVERVRELKAEDGKAIWLCGGALLAGDLYAAGLIDEIIVKVNPIVFGEGIPLFARSVEAGRLVLRETHRFDSGHLIVEYRVAA